MSTTPGLEEAVLRLSEAAKMIQSLSEESAAANEARKREEEERKAQSVKWERHYTALQTKLDKVGIKITLRGYVLFDNSVRKTGIVY